MIVKYDDVEYANYEVEADSVDEDLDMVTEEYNPMTIIEENGKEVRFDELLKLKFTIFGGDDEFNDISFPDGK